jgi:hypothetical protein
MSSRRIGAPVPLLPFFPQSVTPPPLNFHQSRRRPPRPLMASPPGRRSLALSTL